MNAPLKIEPEFTRWDALEMSKYLSEWKRIKTCCSHAREKDVRISESANGPIVNGVITCGSVWLCPVCSCRISMKRKDLLTEAYQRWTDSRPGNAVYLLTFTVKHNKFDRLTDLVPAFRMALHKFWSRAIVRGNKGAVPWNGERDERYTSVFERVAGVRTRKSRGLGLLGLLGYVGRITAMEVKVSQVNGWHPHTHMMVFGNQTSQEVIEDVRNGIADVWSECCEAVGLSASFDVGVDLQEGDSDSVGAYCGKWGLASEMCRWQAKSDIESGHFAPFDLLQLAHHGSVWAAHRWREYAAFFPGQRQLVWSPGLAAQLGLQDEAEASDDELAEEDEATGDKELHVTAAAWFALYRQKSVKELLQIVKENGLAMALGYLEGLGFAGCYIAPSRSKMIALGFTKKQQEMADWAAAGYPYREGTSKRDWYANMRAASEKRESLETLLPAEDLFSADWVPNNKAAECCA